MTNINLLKPFRITNSNFFQNFKIFIDHPVCKHTCSVFFDTHTYYRPGKKCFVNRSLYFTAKVFCVSILLQNILTIPCKSELETIRKKIVILTKMKVSDRPVTFLAGLVIGMTLVFILVSQMTLLHQTRVTYLQ